jgi:hypothetical protein
MKNKVKRMEFLPALLFQRLLSKKKRRKKHFLGLKKEGINPVHCG